MAKKIDPKKKRLQQDFEKYQRNRNNNDNRYAIPKRDFEKDLKHQKYIKKRLEEERIAQLENQPQFKQDNRSDQERKKSQDKVQKEINRLEKLGKGDLKQGIEIEKNTKELTDKISEINQEVLLTVAPIPTIPGLGRVSKGIAKRGNQLFKNKQFKSEIDWGNWNKEIPKNKELLKEYNAIEETTKANGTWMKNPDGSAFKGTPEQFVQQNSSNFKKAFPNPILDKNNNIQINYHGSPNKFSEFKVNDRIGEIGSGIYTTSDRNYAKAFSKSRDSWQSKPSNDATVLELYQNSNNPQNYYKDYEKYVDSKVMDFGNKYRFMPKFTKKYKIAEKKLNNDLSSVHSKLYDEGKINKIQDGFDSFTKKHQTVVPFDNYPKSATGNNGMFDMTNPNIYKSLVPPTILGGTLLNNQQDTHQQQFALGGNLKQQNNMNNLNQFNTGGTHESNPLGGIPIGMGDNGLPNTVEQGETMQNDFVFSDRIVLRPDVISQVGLPKTLANKTIAEATKIIDKQFKDRTSKIDKSTRDAMYDRIAQAQEMIKVEEQVKIAAAQEMNSTEVPDMMDGQIPQGMDQFMQPEAGMDQLPMGAQDGRVQSGMQDLGQPMFRYGGKMNKYQGGGFMNFMGSKEGSSMMGGIGSAVGGISGGSYNQQIQKNAEAGFVDNKLAKDQANEEMLGQTKDAVASALGPFGQAFRGIQKIGKGIGDTVGGDAGAAVSGLFSPEEATMSNLTNPDLNFGEKILGTVPGLGGVIASRAAKKRAEKEAENRERKEFYDTHIGSLSNNDDTKVFAYGGKVNKFEGGGFPKTLQRGQDTLDFQNWMIKNHGKSTGGQDGIPGKGTYTDYTKYGGAYNIGRFSPGVQVDYTDGDYSHLKPKLSEEDVLRKQVTQDKLITEYQDPTYKDGEFDNSLLKTGAQTTSQNKNYGNLARYAPMLMNAFQLNTLGKPQVNRLQRLNNQYQRQFLDEATYQNIAREQASAARNAIGRSGATIGQMIGAQLGTQLGASKAIADSYNQIRQHNIGENRLRQQTRFGNNQFNIQQDNLEQDINDRNKGNWQTQRSKLLGQLGTDFGNVGKEETYKDMAIAATGYNWMGEYMQNNPNATKAEVEKAYKKANPKATQKEIDKAYNKAMEKLYGTNSNRLGGTLNRKLR